MPSPYLTPAQLHTLAAEAATAFPVPDAHTRAAAFLQQVAGPPSSRFIIPDDPRPLPSPPTPR